MRLRRIAVAALAAAVVSTVFVSCAELAVTSAPPPSHPQLIGAGATLAGVAVRAAPLATSGPPPITGQGPDPDRQFPGSLGGVRGQVRNGNRASYNWSGE